MTKEQFETAREELVQEYTYWLERFQARAAAAQKYHQTRLDEENLVGNDLKTTYRKLARAHFMLQATERLLKNPVVQYSAWKRFYAKQQTYVYTLEDQLEDLNVQLALGQAKRHDLRQLVIAKNSVLARIYVANKLIEMFEPLLERRHEIQRLRTEYTQFEKKFEVS